MPTVWPTLDAVSANNFQDHFSSLDATKWGSVTSGTGSISVTDSYALLTAPANSAAFLYYKTELNKVKNQMWRICISRNAGTTGSPGVCIVNGAAAPAADTNANIDAKSLIQRAWANQTSLAILDWYFTAASATTYWGGNIPAWTTTYSNALNSSLPVRNDDYYILGIEFDGPGSRFRLHTWGQTYTAGYTFNQGWRLFGLSDWVAWSASRSSADLWLCIGQMYNNDADAKTYRVEWVDYCEQQGTTLFEGWSACKAALANGHTLRYRYSYDDKFWISQDRTTDALAPTGGGFESADVQAPNVVRDGAGTDWMIYYGSNAVNTDGIAIAKATSVAAGTQQTGPWTRGASNPIISPVAGETRVRYPFMFMDNAETDSTKRWKIIAGVLRTSDSLEVYKLYTSPGPPDTGTWTNRGVIIDKGGAGAKDEGGVLGGGVVSVFYTLAGGYDVWYTGLDASGNYHLLHASGQSLNALVKDPLEYFPTTATATASLTVNLTGRTVTVDNTAGFVQDGQVIFDQDANLDNWSTSRVRKVVNATTLELYTGLDGFATTTPAKMRQMDASPANGGQQMVRRTKADGTFEWRGYITIWNPMQGAGASYGALCEQNMLIKHAAATLTGSTFALDQFYSPVDSRGFNGDLRSVENMGILLGPLQVDAAGGGYAPTGGGGFGGFGRRRRPWIDEAPRAPRGRSISELVEDFFDADLAERVEELTEEAPAAVAERAQAVIDRFPDDLRALEADQQAIALLRDLWVKAQHNRQIAEDDDELTMLGGL